MNISFRISYLYHRAGQVGTILVVVQIIMSLGVARQHGETDCGKCGVGNVEWEKIEWVSGVKKVKRKK